MPAIVIPAAVHAQARQRAAVLRQHAIEQAVAWVGQRLWPQRRTQPAPPREQACHS